MKGQSEFIARERRRERALESRQTPSEGMRIAGRVDWPDAARCAICARPYRPWTGPRQHRTVCLSCWIWTMDTSADDPLAGIDDVPDGYRRDR